MRRMLAFAGIIGVAVLLAFPLRDVVYEAVIVPVAYVLWVLGLAYHSIHQSVWWIVVLVLVLTMIFRSVVPEARPVERSPIKPRPITGQVETLALWMKRSERGTYFKWLIANRLGKVAYQILSRRETGRPRSVFDELTGMDWTPDEDLRSYLEFGLSGSFTDFPYMNRPFSRTLQTPLDYDANKAVEFLESQVKQ